ncbi:MAG TPA: hypothetical protein VMU34_25765, partial [Mycobacterium sp.]|nr:hypothetical protein [Mycobacterium sp.]
MVVTVFVENVLQHTKSAPVVRLEASARRECSRHGTDEVSGLAIIAALCRTGGTAPTASGKTVWAVIGPRKPALRAR